MKIIIVKTNNVYRNYYRFFVRLVTVVKPAETMAPTKGEDTILKVNGRRWTCEDNTRNEQQKGSEKVQPIDKETNTDKRNKHG